MKMKKTLNTGLAVMTLCALLASCGEKEMSSGLSAYSAPLSVTQVTAIATIPKRPTTLKDLTPDQLAVFEATLEEVKANMDAAVGDTAIVNGIEEGVLPLYAGKLFKEWRLEVKHYPLLNDLDELGKSFIDGCLEDLWRYTDEGTYFPSQAVEYIVENGITRNIEEGYLPENGADLFAMARKADGYLLLSELSEYAAEYFEECYSSAVSLQDSGWYTNEEIVELAEADITDRISSDMMISIELLPKNAVALFNEYLNDKGFFEKQNNTTSQETGGNGSNDNGSQQTYTSPVQNETAPQPSYEQQQQTKQDDIPQTKEEMAQRDQEINDLRKQFGLHGTIEGMGRY